MPSYELSVIYKLMNKPEFVSAIKRTAAHIWEHGGLIQKVESLGSKELPYKMSAHGAVHRKGSYFLFYFDYPPTEIDTTLENFHRDIDIVKSVIVKHKTEEQFECTLEEELLPAAYRPSVKKLLEEGKRNKKRLFKPYKPVLDTKPF